MNQESESPKFYTIKELEKAAGVSKRNIHFYVKEGLLPPPQGRGRSAVYTPEHLVRLDLIRLMRESTQLRLDGIREILDPLSLEELETYRKELLDSKLEAAAPYGTWVALRTLEEAVADSGPAPPARRRSKQARRAREEVVAEWVEHEEPFGLSVGKALDIEDTAPGSMRPRGFRRPGMRPRPPREKTPEDEVATWERVKITDDLEIHYRPRADSRFIRDMMSLIAKAKKTFRK